jgi:heme oxygenase (biliverdin-IX-beta and delta-forming)
MTALSAPPATSLRDSIRSLTRDVHVRLEQRMNVERGEWSRERYVAFLRGTLAVVAAVEPAIERHLRPFVLGPEPDGLAAGRLEHDLKAVGADPTAPAASRVPLVTDTASAFGAAYVLEGSRLGGQVVSRLLGSQLGLVPDQMTYLASSGTPVGPHWKAFCAALDAFGATADARTSRTVGEAAVETFASFEQALEDAGALDVR